MFAFEKIINRSIRSLECKIQLNKIIHYHYRKREREKTN